MCSKEEMRKFTAGWASLMIVLILQAGSGLWFFSKLDSRVDINTEKINSKGNFTRGDGRLHQFQIDAIVKLLSKTDITHAETNRNLIAIHDEMEKMVIELKTHIHKPENNGFYSYPAP